MSDATKKTTSFTIGAPLDAFITKMIASGRYGTASEVVRAALRLLQNKETKMEALRRALDEGDASPVADDYSISEVLSKLSTS